MAFTRFGKTRLGLYAATLLVNMIVLALSARVNEFQEFFFVADEFPLVMSIITLVSFLVIVLRDLHSSNTFLGRAPFQIGFLFVLSVFWLAFNAFSTSRWRHVPLQCDTIPANFGAEKTWCKDLQALKSFVWIEWLMIFANFAFTLRYCVSQSSHGNKHVWSTALSRYRPQDNMYDARSSFGQFQPSY